MEETPDPGRDLLERRAIYRAIQHLLTLRTEENRKKWSLQRLADKVDVSYETLRRAHLSPNSVGPALRERIPPLVPATMDELIERFGHAEEDPHDPVNAALLELVYETPDRAELYTRAAAGLRFTKPEGLDRAKAKSLIRSVAADEEGRLPGSPILRVADSVTGPEALKPKRERKP